jgi:protein TonB
MTTNPNSGAKTIADNFGGGFAGALALHGGLAVFLLCWAYVSHSGHAWGDASATAGAIQATMVASLPLPPKQPTNAENVLATEAPSPAPKLATPATTAAPRPDDIAIQAKPTKPTPTADRTAPPPPPHPQPIPADPTKAPAGEAPGIKIAMSTAQNQAGTVSVAVTDASFGARFAYYQKVMATKLESQWNTGMLDSRAAGRRVYITFQIARDGTPSRIKIEQPSGDTTLDQTALTAVQHIDTFGPLPDAYQGSYVNVQYYFEAPSVP